jgi:hypothetical protein
MDGSLRPSDTQKLSESDAQRLLARAAEIERAQGTQLSLAELRAVALEAGIAPNAFEEAVGELGMPAVEVVAEPPRTLLDTARKYSVVAAIVLFGVIVIGAVFIPRIAP